MQLRGLAGVRFFFFFNWSALIKVYVPQSCGGAAIRKKILSSARMVLLRYYSSTSRAAPREPLGLLLCGNPRGISATARRRLVFMQIVSCNIYATLEALETRKHSLLSLLF